MSKRLTAEMFLRQWIEGEPFGRSYYLNQLPFVLYPRVIECMEGFVRSQIKVVENELAESLEALRNLHDAQNGPPLIRHQAEWQVAMQQAAAVLHKHGR